MGSPWPPPQSTGAQPHWPTNGGNPASYGSPPEPPTRQTRRWGLIAAVVAANIVAIAAASGLTYAITAHNTSEVATPPRSPSYSAAEQADAKDKVCRTFDEGERGSAGKGGVVVNGDLNVPIVLRKVNSVLAVGNALSGAPATPPDVTAAAEKYVATATNLTTAALANAPVDELVRLTQTGNAAIADFSDACGLPR